MALFLDLPAPAEFVDRHGIVRAIATCSPVGRVQFWEAIVRLGQLLEGGNAQDSWWDLHDGNQEFRHLVIRCLELNGVDKDWVNLQQIGYLLFEPGYLLQLNRGEEAIAPSAEEEESTLYTYIASLWQATGNPEMAMRMAADVPSIHLDKILEAYGDRLEQSTPEGKKRHDRKKAQREIAKDWDKIANFDPDALFKRDEPPDGDPPTPASKRKPKKPQPNGGNAEAILSA